MIDAQDSVIEPDLMCGWNKNRKEIQKQGPEVNISERQFYRYRMALRSGMDDSQERRLPFGKKDFHWLWFARRLAEYFVIAVLNRIERHEMDIHKSQQKKDYRQILARDYVAAIEKGIKSKGPNAKLGKIFLTPQTFAGSRQYYQKKYADLMAIIRKLGNPTWLAFFSLVMVTCKFLENRKFQVTITRERTWGWAEVR